MRMTKKIATAIAAGTILAATLLPGAAFADNTIIIDHNGAGSTNTASVGSVNIASVGQSNASEITNFITQTANTGDNSAFGNTGGNTTILTGNSSATSIINISGNANTAVISPFPSSNNSITITNNGAGSINSGTATSIKIKTCTHSNIASVLNLKIQTSHTGGNTAFGNTGGNTTINTGHSTTASTATTSGNTNHCSL